jgi:DNA repair exonuclease SbcCD ATPase subunit
MRQISAQRLTLEHFKSFVEPTAVDLGESGGLIFVAGDNRVEPRLGANGAGKSTLLDALCFALYGYSVHGVRASDLLSPGARRLSVGVLLRVDDREVTVTRSGPPERLLVDNKPAMQSDIEALVGLSRDRFLASVVFGQAMPLFIDMPPPERGALLDEVLDLALWMRAADRAGKAASAAEAEINRLLVEIGRAEGALSALEDPAVLATREAAWESERRARVEAMIGEVAELEAAQGKVQVAKSKAPDVEAAWRAYQKVEDRKGVLGQEYARLAERCDQAEEQIAFFDENETCPTCAQSISRKFAHSCRTRLEGILADAEAGRDSEAKKLEEVKVASLAKYRAWEAARRAADAERIAEAKRRAEREAADRSIADLERRIEVASGEANPHTAARERAERERRRLEGGLREQREREVALRNRLGALDFWRQGFRRVRLFCIGRVSRELDIEAMNAAAELGLVGWHIKHSTETETKSGGTRLGVQITVESPTLVGSFRLWSGGEGQRVRLASALGLANLVQRWAGVRWDMEVFDEPTAWLSESGIEDLLALLRARADLTGRRIFLIDHRALSFAGFSRVMTVVKDERGSHVE